VFIVTPLLFVSGNVFYMFYKTSVGNCFIIFEEKYETYCFSASVIVFMILITLVFFCMWLKSRGILKNCGLPNKNYDMFSISSMYWVVVLL